MDKEKAELGIRLMKFEKEIEEITSDIVRIMTEEEFNMLMNDPLLDNGAKVLAYRIRNGSINNSKDIKESE